MYGWMLVARMCRSGRLAVLTVIPASFWVSLPLCGHSHPEMFTRKFPEPNLVWIFLINFCLSHSRHDVCAQHYCLLILCRTPVGRISKPIWSTPNESNYMPIWFTPSRITCLFGPRPISRATCLFSPPQSIERAYLVHAKSVELRAYLVHAQSIELRAYLVHPNQSNVPI